MPLEGGGGTILSTSEWLGDTYLCCCILMQDERGSTALITASDEGHLETAKVLLHRGALVNFQNKVRILLGNLVRNKFNLAVWWSALQQPNFLKFLCA